MWCLSPSAAGQCPAAGHPFSPGVATSRSALLPAEEVRGVLAWTPQGEGLLRTSVCRHRALWQLPASGAPVRVPADPIPWVHRPAGCSPRPGGSGSVACFRAGPGVRGRKAGEVLVARLRRLLACFSEAMLCDCDYPSGLLLSRSSLPLT